MISKHLYMCYVNQKWQNSFFLTDKDMFGGEMYGNVFVCIYNSCTTVDRIEFNMFEHEMMLWSTTKHLIVR